MEQKTVNAPNRLRTSIDKPVYIGIYPFVRYIHVFDERFTVHRMV